MLYSAIKCSNRKLTTKTLELDGRVKKKSRITQLLGSIINQTDALLNVSIAIKTTSQILNFLLYSI